MDSIERKYGQGAELVWKDRKRFLGMPLSFTRYILVRKPGAWVKLFLNVGLINSIVDELNLYRVCDITLSQSLLGRMLNTGTVTLYSSDESNPTILLKNVKNPYQVRDMFSNIAEEQRKVHNIRLAEFHRHD